MTRAPTHLGDGAYVQDDPHTPGGIIVTTHTHDLDDINQSTDDIVRFDAQAVAALLRWLDADPKAEIVAWLRSEGPGSPADVYGSAHGGSEWSTAADAIERGDCVAGKVAT